MRELNCGLDNFSINTTFIKARVFSTIFEVLWQFITFVLSATTYLSLLPFASSRNMLPSSLKNVYNNYIVRNKLIREKNSKMVDIIMN